MKQYPGLVEEGGNLAALVEQELVGVVTGRQVLFRETLRAKTGKHAAGIGRPQTQPHRGLLVERVVVCWLQVYHADAAAAQAENHTFVQGDYNQRRQDRAHRRFLSAVKTLATVRRLALPTLVAVSVTGSVETKAAEPAPVSRRWRLPAGANN